MFDINIIVTEKKWLAWGSNRPPLDYKSDALPGGHESKHLRSPNYRLYFLNIGASNPKYAVNASV